MKKYILLIVFVFVFSLNVLAGEYEGLTPGISTKADANSVFGKPIRQNTAKGFYEYSTAGHDLAQLSITVQKQNVIDRINLLFQEPYSVNQVKEWFDLPQQATETEMANGHFVEYYQGQGIKIVFQGTNNKGNVIQLSHVDGFKAKKFVDNVVSNSDSCPSSSEKYAKQADPYIAKDQYAQAIPHLEKAAMCDPSRVIYTSMLAFSYLKTNQLNKAIETAKKVVEKNEDYISYSVLGTAYFRKKDYASAIPYLEKATGFSQDKKLKDNLEFLGFSYYSEGRLNESRTAFAESYKRKKSPMNTYYIALISDRIGEKGDARYYYKKYLKMRHDNKEMNRAAKERLSVLSKDDNDRLREKTSRATQTIIQTIFGNNN